MIVTALFALALTAPQTVPITADQLSWMSGYWLSCDGGREVSETWSDPRGGLMAGTGMTLQDGRASFELSRIAPVSAGAPGVAYFAGVEGAPPVIFTAVEATASRVVFENLAHDFPQRVIYERDGDALNAQIEGGGQVIAWQYQKAELNARCPG